MEQTLDDLLASVRWLSPDAELDRLTDDARLFIHSIADELAGIWQQHAKQELPVLAPYITRSASDAVARWTRSCAAPSVDRFRSHTATVDPWSAAHQSVLTRRLAVERDAPPLLDAIHRFRALIEGASLPVPEPWKPAWSLLLPGFFTVYRHWYSGAKMPATYGAPSPWGPLVALWTRGVWPVLCPNGELIVWVPTRRDGAIVRDADAKPEAPIELTPSKLYGGELLPPGRLPIMLCVVGGAMTVQPLAKSSFFDLGLANVSIGTVGPNNAGGIERVETAGRERYVAMISAVGSVRCNGEPRESFVLTPGDEITVDGRAATGTQFFLGARADDDVAQPQYDATKLR